MIINPELSKLICKQNSIPRWIKSKKKKGNVVNYYLEVSI